MAVTAVGSDGTVVTLIQSVFQSFGAGLLEPDTGLVLHNRGSAFSLDPAHPGRVHPGNRPPHTLCPLLDETTDGAVVALGCQGGQAQAWILAQVADDLISSADPSAVLDRPRWVIGGRDLGSDRPVLVLEPGMPGTDRLSARAAAMGLDVTVVDARHDDAGHVQVCRLDGVGGLTAATDPRADGAAGLIGS